jgi:NADH:ubiquinone oxidoreductase subunit H
MNIVVFKYVLVLCVVIIGSILVVWFDRKDSEEFDELNQ